MKKLLDQEQMRAADAFTIKEKGISSIDLMESASQAFVNAFVKEVSDQETPIAVLCGKGNNGGDGLAIARLLKDSGYSNVSVYLIAFSSKETEEYKVNLKRLEELWFTLVTVSVPADLPDLKGQVVIDAVLGSGLNKPLEGHYLELVELVNKSDLSVIAVDIPTGFPAEGVLVQDGIYLKADLVICFQRPKINFFFPESIQALKRFEVVDIGLDEAFIENCDCPYRLTDILAVKELVKTRRPFTHKGTYGHALIVAGQKETMGAALLSAGACLHGGAGLTTVSIPESGLTALNGSLPEVMYLDREKIDKNAIEKFKIIAAGPGLGTVEGSVELMERLLKLEVPLIIDADALNILGNHQNLLGSVISGSVLTPHMKEFDHLFGDHDSWWKRLETARKKAVEMDCVIILKNQYTFIVGQDGNVTVNPTGNPAMAQGGMGDALTGLVASFMAQGFTAEQSAYVACYLHGKAGDDLAIDQVTVTASAVAAQVPKTLKKLII